MDRVILHCDCNSFFASVECMLDPSLKKFPVAVCGSEEDRRGIVLAKNEEVEIVWMDEIGTVKKNYVMLQMDQTIEIE